MKKRPGFSRHEMTPDPLHDPERAAGDTAELVPRRGTAKAPAELAPLIAVCDLFAAVRTPPISRCYAQPSIF